MKLSSQSFCSLPLALIAALAIGSALAPNAFGETDNSQEEISVDITELQSENPLPPLDDERIETRTTSINPSTSLAVVNISRIRNNATIRYTNNRLRNGDTVAAMWSGISEYRTPIQRVQNSTSLVFRVPIAVVRESVGRNIRFSVSVGRGDNPVQTNRPTTIAVRN